jgi:hypothetical protein
VARLALAHCSVRLSADLFGSALTARAQPKITKQEQLLKMAEESTPVFPVSAWHIGPVLRMEMVIVRFAFLSHALQKPEEADPGRNYALTLAQTRMLVKELERSIQQLEKSGPQTPDGQKH